MRTPSNEDKYNDDIDGNDDDVFYEQTIGADMHALPGDPRQRLPLTGIYGPREGTAASVPTQGSHNMMDFPEQTVAESW